MTKFNRFAFYFAVALVLTLPALFAHDTGAPVTLAKPSRLADGTVQLTITGSGAQTVVLQTSSDHKNWQDLKTVYFTGGQLVVSDPDAGRFDRRFYRVRSDAASVSLPDLTQLIDRVFMPADGFNTVQFAPSGKLGFIVWRDTSLIYRERDTGGHWIESVVANSRATYQPKGFDEHRFQPPAALVFDSASRPHVLVASGSTISHYTGNGTGWSAEQISASSAGSSFAFFNAAIGPSDKLHIAVIATGNSPAVTYGTNRDGSWTWTRVTNISGDPRGFYRQAYAPRYFSMAVDSNNRAHLTFTPWFSFATGPEGYPRPLSELHYASNSSGQWRTQRIAGVADGSGDAGLGSSVAIGPDNRPAIASWYNERASTGSAQESKLMYHRQDSNGNWSSTILVRSADGYVGGDGSNRSGFAPYLRFDSKGNPQIIFSDHASQHFWQSGQNEFAGQIRRAYWNGSGWATDVLYRQTNPLTEQLIYPAFAVSPSGNEIVSMGLKRNTIWGPDSWPRTVTSTYQFVFQTKSL